MKPLKAYENVLNLCINMSSKQQVVDSYPIYANIDPTTYCNLSCPACTTGLKLNLRPVQTMKFDHYKAIIDEIGDYLFQVLLYNWGEPLLHKQAPEFIRYAKEKEINVQISTNFSIKFSDDYLERLVKSGLNLILIALDGATPETYSKYRRGGDFNLVRENMLRLRIIRDKLGYKTPTIAWKFVVFRHNEHEVQKAIDEHKDWGADTMVFDAAVMPSDPYNDGIEPSTMPEFNTYVSERRRKAIAENLAKTSGCSRLWGVTAFGPTGRVYPCCWVSEEEDDFGQYSESEGFLSAWNSPRYQQARRSFANRTKGSTIKSEDEFMKILHATDGSGMGKAGAVKKDGLVCNRCPVPEEWNHVEELIKLMIPDMSPGKEKDLLLRALQVLHEGELSFKDQIA